jgi:hypothetical protein
MTTQPMETIEPGSGPLKGDFFLAMLRDEVEVDRIVCDAQWGMRSLYQLLGLTLSGLLLHGLALGMVIHLAMDSLPLLFAAKGEPIFWVPLSLIGGILAAIAICLPSFYFYTQLAGLDASFRLITAQSLRVQARTSVLLMGLLPFFLAWALTPFLQIPGISDINQVVAIGFALPFFVGFAGLYSVYQSFRRLSGQLPITHVRRGNIMLRLVLCWGAVMATVAPVAVFRLAQVLSGGF